MPENVLHAKLDGYNVKINDDDVYRLNWHHNKFGVKVKQSIENRKNCKWRLFAKW